MTPTIAPEALQVDKPAPVPVDDIVAVAHDAEPAVELDTERPPSGRQKHRMAQEVGRLYAMEVMGHTHKGENKVSRFDMRVAWAVHLLLSSFDKWGDHVTLSQVATFCAKPGQAPPQDGKVGQSLKRLRDLGFILYEPGYHLPGQTNPVPSYIAYTARFWKPVRDAALRAKGDAPADADRPADATVDGPADDDLEHAPDPVDCAPPATPGVSDRTNTPGVRPYEHGGVSDRGVRIREVTTREGSSEKPSSRPTSSSVSPPAVPTGSSEPDRQTLIEAGRADRPHETDETELERHGRDRWNFLSAKQQAAARKNAATRSLA